MKHLMKINELATRQDWQTLGETQFKQSMERESMDDFTPGEITAIVSALKGGRGKTLAEYRSISYDSESLWDCIQGQMTDFQDPLRTCDLSTGKWVGASDDTPSNFLHVKGKRDFMLRVVKSVDDYFYVLHTPGINLLRSLYYAASPIDPRSFSTTTQQDNHYVCDGIKSLKALIKHVSR